MNLEQQLYKAATEKHPDDSWVKGATLRGGAGKTAGDFSRGGSCYSSVIKPTLWRYNLVAEVRETKLRGHRGFSRCYGCGDEIRPGKVGVKIRFIGLFSPSRGLTHPTQGLSASCPITPAHEGLGGPFICENHWFSKKCAVEIACTFGKRAMVHQDVLVALNDTVKEMRGCAQLEPDWWWSGTEEWEGVHLDWDGWDRSYGGEEEALVDQAVRRRVEVVKFRGQSKSPHPWFPGVPVRKADVYAAHREHLVEMGVESGDLPQPVTTSPHIGMENQQALLERMCADAPPIFLPWPTAEGG